MNDAQLREAIERGEVAGWNYKGAGRFGPITQIGGEGALGKFATMLQQDGAGGILGALDRDGDGNPLNDLGGIASGLFGKK